MEENEKLEKLGKLFEYKNDFLSHPVKYGYISLYQIGELYGYAGYEVGEHIQICAEISYIISGAGSFYIDDKKYPVQGGDVFLNMFGERHRIAASEKEDLRFFYLGFLVDQTEAWKSEELIKLWQFYTIPHQNPVAHGSVDIHSIVSKLNNEFYHKKELSNLAIEYLLSQMLLTVYRCFVLEEECSADMSKGGGTGAVIFNIVLYIDNHIFDCISVQDISKSLGYSASYLSHLFKAQMDITIQQYVIKRRIEKSREMIAQREYNLTQISEMLHYESLQSFSRTFKKVMRVSPSRYLETVEKKGIFSPQVENEQEEPRL